MTENDDDLLFTVGSVWREERVSCPHPDIIRAWVAGALDPALAEFVAFHIDESQCPYCAAVVEELKAAEDDAARDGLEAMKSRLMRSTVSALRASRPEA